MKALQLLDHVMLRWARGFSAVLAGFLVFPIVLIVFSASMIFLLLWLGGSEPSIASKTAIEALASLKDPRHLLTLTYTLLFFVSVRLLPSRIARICLGITTSIPAAALACSIPFLSLVFFTSRHDVSIFFLGIFDVLSLLCFFGFFSMTWISIRPPNPSPNLVNPV